MVRPVTDMPEIIRKIAALVAGLALFSSCGSKDAPTVPSPGQLVVRVVVLGDSLAFPSLLQSSDHLQYTSTGRAWMLRW